MSSRSAIIGAGGGRLGVSLAVAVAVFGIQTAFADKGVAIGSGSLTELHTPDGSGGMARYASGGGAAITLLCGCDDALIGGELGVMFLGNEDDARLYDLAASFMMSWNVKKRSAAPFIAVGFDIAGVDDDRLDEDQKRLLFGVHGRAGLHGFWGEKLYWRAEAGFLGAGPGGLTAGIRLGYAFSGR